MPGAVAVPLGRLTLAFVWEPVVALDAEKVRWPAPTFSETGRQSLEPKPERSGDRRPDAEWPTEFPAPN